MSQYTKNATFRLAAAALVVLLMPFVGCAAEANTDVEEIKNLIGRYATSIDKADTNIADQIWSKLPEVTFHSPAV